MSGTVFSPRATLATISRGGKSHATVLSEYAQKLYSAAYSKDPAGAGFPKDYTPLYTYSADNGDPRTSSHNFTCTVTFFTTPSKRAVTIVGTLSATTKAEAQHNAAADALAHIEKLSDQLLLAPYASSTSSSSVRTQSAHSTFVDAVCDRVAKTSAPFAIQVYRTSRSGAVCVSVRVDSQDATVTNAPKGTSADAMLDAIRHVLDAGFPAQHQQPPPTIDDELLALFDGDDTAEQRDAVSRK
jgi:hypothetical protein